MIIIAITAAMFLIFAIAIALTPRGSRHEPDDLEARMVDHCEARATTEKDT